nr:MAG TPA: hypothetical protein [Caudoviricetes sp.]
MQQTGQYVDVILGLADLVQLFLFHFLHRPFSLISALRILWFSRFFRGGFPSIVRAIS